MRMTENHLVAQLVAYISNIKLLFLLTYPAVEHNMQQDIAQLLANLTLVIADDGIAELIGLLDGIRTQRLVGLLTVPRTLHAQTIHDIQQPSEGFHFFLSGMFLFHKYLQRYEKKVNKGLIIKKNFVPLQPI